MASVFLACSCRAKVAAASASALPGYFSGIVCVRGAEEVRAAAPRVFTVLSRATHTHTHTGMKREIPADKNDDSAL